MLKAWHMPLIAIVGPKHSGKTSAGRELALLLNCGFADLDNLIIEGSGKSPRALYAEGAEIFQKAETAAMALLVAAGCTGPLVIAPGGGLIDNQNALALLLSLKPSIFCLGLGADEAWERISKAGEIPPFLANQEAHRVLHESRTAAYSRLALSVIKAGGKSPREIALEINKIRLSTSAPFGG
jgi:shikimate kinase